MRRDERRTGQTLGQGLIGCLQGSVVWRRSGGGHGGQHRGAGQPGGVGAAHGMVAVGRARDGGQQGGLGQGQCGGGLAEIEPAGRANPHHVAAERGQIDVELKDLLLGVAALQLEGPETLDELGRHGAGLGLGQTRHLHGDGGAAAHHAPCPQVGQGRLQDGQGVHAGMNKEAAVFACDHGVQEHRGHLGKGHGEAPGLVRGQEEADGRVAVVQNHGGGGRGQALHREGQQRVQPPKDGWRRKKQHEGDGQKPPPPFGHCHCPPSTLMAPRSVPALISG